MLSAGSRIVASQETLTGEQEYYLGRAVSAKIVALYPPVFDETKTRYLSEVGATLVGVSDAPETFGGYRFAVIKSPTINAMSAPGGFIYVSSGFIDLLRDEDSLAAVLAHEIAHVVRRDGVNAISNAALLSALSEASIQGASIAVTKSTGAPQVGALTEALSGSVEGVMEKLLTKGFDRSQEYKADLYAALLLQRAGYDPAALKGVLSILAARGDGGNAGWFATHPAPSDRLEKLDDDFSFAPPPREAATRLPRFKKAFAR